ncbi:RRQRL motif-containing zinc-binding protein [Streptomyces sp. H39-C1]|uniref:RRQRL motif-containing zinc-binding protein n=1 Tax=Streptomyces sp. H39-C1 TaxID=3004355 RepID=UPI0022AE8713|nr:RRQRL motif-containing zinc-binding protein [Streptomyces sp. H39-C1]MCZ4102664.1 hypothetical protein [Streptomyces sp. H39-C1]
MAAYAKFFDPDGDRYGLPTWPFRMAPQEYATRRQLRALGLRPGGQPIAGQVLWRSRRRKTEAAYLFLIADAKPVRPMTPARWASVHGALRARRICRLCHTEREYEISRRLGACNICSPDDGYATAA